MPVQGLTVTPVVSFPQESVMVLVFCGLLVIAFLTGSRAASPTPARVPALTIIL